MTITKICDMLKKELLNNGYEYGFGCNGFCQNRTTTKVSVGKTEMIRLLGE